MDFTKFTMFSAMEFYIVLAIVGVVLSKNLSSDDPTVLTSTYSRVANFGKSPVNEGRSSGQSLYTQSSDAKVTRGQNLNAKVRYYTSKPSRIGQDQYEVLPAKGEVIQERFNPRPYFDYVHEAHKTESGQESAPAAPAPAPPAAAPKPVYGAPFDSFPVFKPPDSNDGPIDAKPSDFDSISPVYNPSPDTKPADFDSISPVYKPSSYSKPSEFDSKPPADTYDSKPISYDASPSQNSYDSPYSSYNPPSAMTVTKEPDAMNPPQQFLPTAAKPDAAPPSYESYGPMPTYTDNKEMKPESTEGSYPSFPYAPHQQDSPPKGFDSYGQAPPQIQAPNHDVSDIGPSIVQTVQPPGSYQDYSSSYHGHYHPHDHSQADDSLPPEQPPPPSDFVKVPEYLDHEPKDHGYNYPDDHYFDHHHVYHEVTTTTEAPEERVNKGQYSYYYLGRKLWYVPLYFSVYFIIYIAVLILKSIARHKVTFWQDLQGLHAKENSARSLNLDSLTANVTSAIDNANNKYMM